VSYLRSVEINVLNRLRDSRKLEKAHLSGNSILLESAFRLRVSKRRLFPWVDIALVPGVGSAQEGRIEATASIIVSTVTLERD